MFKGMFREIGEMLGNLQIENDKLKQTLQEIKEIINKSFDSCYTCNSETACKRCIRGDILNKISEVVPNEKV